jgi:hypothetical protein
LAKGTLTKRILATRRFDDLVTFVAKQFFDELAQVWIIFDNQAKGHATPPESSG